MNGLMSLLIGMTPMNDQKNSRTAKLQKVVTNLGILRCRLHVEQF